MDADADEEEDADEPASRVEDSGRALGGSARGARETPRDAAPRARRTARGGAPRSADALGALPTHAPR